MADATKFEIDCDYEELDYLADRLLRLTGEDANGGARIVSAANALKTAGEWAGRDKFVEDLRNEGNKVTALRDKMHELGQKMKEVVAAMREANDEVYAILSK